MKRVRINRLGQYLITSIQFRVTIATIIPLKTPKSKARLLSVILDECVALHAVHPSAPRHIPLYPFCGVPILRKRFSEMRGVTIKQLFAQAITFAPLPR